MRIVTTRYAAVVMAFLEEFPQAVAMLDGRIQDSESTVWCTNAKLKSAWEFSLSQKGKQLLCFYDDPSDMYAADELQPCVETLAKRKLLRIRVSRAGRPVRVKDWAGIMAVPIALLIFVAAFVAGVLYGINFLARIFGVFPVVLAAGVLFALAMFVRWMKSTKGVRPSRKP